MTLTLQHDLFTVIKERHSVKHYDPEFKISRDELKEMLELAHQAPSSWNLQAWKFFVCDEPSTQNKLLPIAYGQQQIVQASAVVAILGDLQASLNAEDVFGEMVQEGLMPEEIKESLISQVNQAYEHPQVARDEAVLNASLAAMQFMLVAKAKGYDTCPMGGFDRKKFSEAFAIPDRFIPVMLISVGKAAKPARPSNRLPIEDVVFWNAYPSK